MASKFYGYYLKGNKVAIIQKDTTDTSTNDYGRYKSPNETVSNGLEVEYTYAPTYNLQSTGTEGSDFHRFLGWGSDGTNLLLFTFSGASSVVDISSLFTEGDWIYLEGSGRWSGLHQVKTGGTSHRARGILTLETKCNLKPSHISVVGTFEEDDETFIWDNAAAIVDIETFKDVINVNRPSPHIFIDLAANGNNHGLFSLTTNETSGKITLNKKFSIDSDGDYTETDAACVDSGNDTISIYNVFQENLSVYEGVEVLENESFELDLTRYQGNAIVYYLKARMAEDMGDFERREFYMREWKKCIEKEKAARKRGPYIIQGLWNMKNY